MQRGSSELEKAGIAENRGLYCPLIRIVISQCNDPYAGFTAVTKRSGIDGRSSK